VALLLLTTFVYRPVLRMGFLLVDDPSYVLQNAPVRQGLTLHTVLWAFRSVEGANWHPLTWLSHAFDCQLFGLWAGGHHATSLALHLTTVALVFGALRALTGAAWRSLAVAAIVALHPMNVESVAWIAERKNVLSGAVFAGTLLAYAFYARRPSPRGYGSVTLLLVLGLLAKPMLVTVPFVLLLLDVWPLARWQPGGVRRLIVEKLPWLALSAASSVVTVYAQAADRAVASLQDYSVPTRLCVAASGALLYVERIFWPARLAVYVPIPEWPCQTLPVRTAAVVLLAITAAVLILVRRRPYLAMGWAWFLGMLVPVCGLVQVGSQLIADRYVYHPIVGLATAVVFGLTDRVSPRFARVTPMLLALLIAVLAWRTSHELGYWRNDETLFTRAILITGPNCMAETQLGVALRNGGDPAGAMLHWRQAIEQCPGSGEAHSHLGAALANQGDFDAAIPHFAAAAELRPDLAVAMRYNLGLALWYKGQPEDALREFRRAVALDPRHEPSLEMIRRAESGER
jgi:protein O-mannosyl-transferase